VFSVVHAILLKPPPFPQAEHLVMPWRVAPIGPVFGSTELTWTERDFPPFLRITKTFEHLGAFKSDAFNLTGEGDPALLDGIRASAGFFPALGIAPVCGRAFTQEEDQPGHEHEVVLSHALWSDRFGADCRVVGRAVRLNGEAYTVVGVMPAGFAFPRGEEMPVSFDFPREAQLWVPLALPPAPPFKPGWDDLALIGRLKPGVTAAAAQAELDVFAKRLEAEIPASKGWLNCRVTPLARQVAGDTRRPLLLLLGAVGVVLLIACSNVANLLLARALVRKRELTLRAALGAAQGRLIRHLFTESLLVAVAGGLAGLLIAVAAIHLVQTQGPAGIPRLREAGLDLPAFVFDLAVTLLTGLLFGLAPALGASRNHLAEDLKAGGQRSGGGPASPRLRQALVVSEVALALVLVIATGLLVRTFFQVLNSDPGFRAAHVLTFQLPLPSVRYTDADHAIELLHKTLAALQAVPGVESAALVTTVPMAGPTNGSTIRLSNQPPATGKDKILAGFTVTSPGYFATVGTHLLRGRDFLTSDTTTTTPVAVINGTMAKRFWPHENPLGKQVGPGKLIFPLMTIVGVVEDIRHTSLREEISPEVYAVYTQKPWPSMLAMQFAVRTKGEPGAVTAGLRAAIRAVDPELPVAKVATLEALTAKTMARPRFSMLLLGGFGGLALLLASIGLYGVISYSVTQRAREIGIRMALGGQRRAMFAMILGQGARLGGLGILLGLLAALGATRWMASFLYGIQATDPLTFAAVTVLLLAVALLACYLPARRATRVDPMTALRSD
jgi:putative ABC transport system permease protein